jgi:hypothetical protein
MVFTSRGRNIKISEKNNKKQRGFRELYHP